MLGPRLLIRYATGEAGVRRWIRSRAAPIKAAEEGTPKGVCHVPNLGRTDRDNGRWPSENERVASPFRRHSYRDSGLVWRTVFRDCFLRMTPRLELAEEKEVHDSWGEVHMLGKARERSSRRRRRKPTSGHEI